MSARPAAICIWSLHTRWVVITGHAVIVTGNWTLQYEIHTHWKTHNSLFSLNHDHFLLGRNWLFFIHEKTKKEEVEEVRRSTWRKVCMTHFCVCATDAVLSVSPNRIPLNTIQYPDFEKKKTSSDLSLQLHKSDQYHDVTQQRGSTYMVIGTGTAGGAVCVRVVLSVMLRGYLQFDEGCWNSEQLFPGCRALKERYEWHSI